MCHHSICLRSSQVTRSLAGRVHWRGFMHQGRSCCAAIKTVMPLQHLSEVLPGHGKPGGSPRGILHQGHQLCHHKCGPTQHLLQYPCTLPGEGSEPVPNIVMHLPSTSAAGLHAATAATGLAVGAPQAQPQQWQNITAFVCDSTSCS